MPHDFEIADEITVDATPEQVWQAIATGPGVDSWFMGRTEIEPGLGGHNRLDMTTEMGFVQQSTITAWEPAQRLAFREESEDGTFTAFEYLIEGRDGGSTSLRFVHNGILGDDDWEGQYDGMRIGDRMYLEQLGVYTVHFAGRHATRHVFLLGPSVPDEQQVWSRFTQALTLDGDLAAGAPIRLNVPGLPAVIGEIAFINQPHYIGVRTEYGILSLLKGYQDMLVVGYHGFSDEEDSAELESAWRSWLTNS